MRTRGILFYYNNIIILLFRRFLFSYNGVDRRRRIPWDYKGRHFQIQSEKRITRMNINQGIHTLTDDIHTRRFVRTSALWKLWRTKRPLFFFLVD